MNLKTWQIVLITAIAVYMLHSKISTLPGVSKLPSV
jgi:hypothetical protein